MLGGRQVRGAAEVSICGGHSDDGFGTISVARETVTHYCDYEEIRVVYAYLHFLLSQSDAADYTGTRRFVWLWVPSVLCLEYCMVLRTIYASSICQRNGLGFLLGTRHRTRKIAERKTVA